MSGLIHGNSRDRLAGRSSSGASFTMLLWPTGEGLIQMRTQLRRPVPAVIAGIGLVIHPATVGTRLRGESQELPGVVSLVVDTGCPSVFSGGF
jgi:hypothetical protein